MDKTDLNESRTGYQKARQRRALVSTGTLLLELGLVALVLSQFPRGRVPVSVRGPMCVLCAAVMVGANLFYERPDQWQRTRAAGAFAIAGLCGTVWLISAALMDGRDSSAHTAGFALAVIGVAWIASDFLLRMWPSMRSADRE